MSKSPHTPEWKIAIVKKYLSGEGSYESLARAHGIGKRTLIDWVRRYQEHGTSVFYRTTGSAHYSKEFKTMCVEAVLNGEGSVDDIVTKYNISGRSVLRSWIMKYNANMELKDYEPKREVYMAEARRKTTLAERKEIVEYCIAHVLFEYIYRRSFSAQCDSGIHGFLQHRADAGTLWRKDTG